MSRVAPPPAEAVERAVAAALAEDLGAAGDITTAALVPEGSWAEAILQAEEPLTAAGAAVALRVFQSLDARVSEVSAAEDGSSLGAGEALLRVRGPARALLVGERTALNLLGRLCGIATRTRRAVEQVRGTRTRIFDTRKTTPGLRLLEKYAVRCGGGENHRMGLHDMALIKENHIAIAGGVGEAVRKARRALPSGIRLQVEVTDLAGLDAALAAGADLILFDNMPLPLLKAAAERARGRAETEASGGIGTDAVGEIARQTGVDRISLGALTRGAVWADISMDLVPAQEA
jgi:nicotinate-nucleotide pyrophosphorylase (carboxylating)